MKEVLKIINLRLNIFNNRTSKFSPFELIHGYNWFDINKKKLEHLKDASNNTYKASLETNTRLNKKRIKNFQYTVGNYLLLQKPFHNGLEPLFTGPYEIIKLSDDKNRILIKSGNKISWENIKRTKPFKWGNM